MLKKVRKNDNGWRTVRPGDSLQTLAKKHGTTAAKIASLNNMSNGASLIVGGKIKVK